MHCLYVTMCRRRPRRSLMCSLRREQDPTPLHYRGMPLPGPAFKAPARTDIFEHPGMAGERTQTGPASTSPTAPTSGAGRSGTSFSSPHLSPPLRGRQLMGKRAGHVLWEGQPPTASDTVTWAGWGRLRQPGLQVQV